MIKLPTQLNADNSSLISGWPTSRPKFYGVETLPELPERLVETEKFLRNGHITNLNPKLCRVLAAYHGLKGAKVPLTVSTITGCIRPHFVTKNETITPSSSSCYDGHCYLFHARSVPGKKDNKPRVFAHRTKHENLVAAAKISQHFRVPIRDNQSSDGSLSMSLYDKRRKQQQLLCNLELLAENGFIDVPYLCFSSAYTKVDDKTLSRLSPFASLVVHVTVSGWHSKAENLLRLREFEKYSEYIKNTWVRVVNRQDWAGIGKRQNSSGARCELWLLEEIEKRGLLPKVIRTPFHSISPFPGSRVGTLGSRHMAGTEYSTKWSSTLSAGALECCSTGKCKTCPTKCGVFDHTRKPIELPIAFNAYRSMLYFEMERHHKEGSTPLSHYVTRLLAKKTCELANEDFSIEDYNKIDLIRHNYSQKISRLYITQKERRRLVNDSHALVQDGIDRHRLWKSL